ncbi:MAG TPA: hypothetical protein PK225_09675 [Azonexus sp.]|nr:hypothetical protein [Azonexus sp.]
MTRTPATPWYRVSDMPPPLGVRVRVMWGSRIFEAARVRHPVSKKLVWLTHDRNLGAVFLPLASALVRETDGATPWQGWHGLSGSEPQCYQPLNPALWAVALPEPINGATVSEVSEALPGGGETGSVADFGGDDADTWWLDPLAIVYQPHGRVTMRMALGRVMRAVSWCGAGGGTTLICRTTAQALDMALASDPEMRAPSRFVPLPQDISDFDTALGWFVQLNPPETWRGGRSAWSFNRRQRVVLWRARRVPLSFADIADRLNAAGGRRIGRERARQVYESAIETCWRAANGLKVGTHPTPAERMAAIRSIARASRGGHAAD